MKKNIWQKAVATSLVCISLGNPVITVAANESIQEMVTMSNQVLEEFPIKNGDFNDGLNHWIVSSPGTDNPTLITEGGNHYVKATHGENIHQYLTLKPNKTYKFAYDVAGSTNFPAKVEFGTLNHGEAFMPLQESEHTNEEWERKQFTFSTPDVENTYIIRFSSTGDGWATFDNIQVYVEDTEAPTAPENLRASDITETSVKLEWDASTDNVGVTGYQIFRDGKKIETVSGEKLTFTDEQLADNTEYQYTVRAIDAAGNVSEASNIVKLKTEEIKDTEAPTAPKNLKASDITESSVKLSWDASTDNVGVKGYRIYRNNQVLVFVSGTTFKNTGLKDGTKYSYKVVAVDAAGNVSEASNTVQITTKEAVDTEAPTAPKNLKASDITESSAKLSWEAATDNKGVTEYQIFRDGKQITTVNGTTLNFKDSGLKEDTTYKYTAKALDAAGNVSVSSNEVLVTTKTASDTEAPTVPQNIRLTDVRTNTALGNELEIAWDASSDNRAVVAYKIYVQGKLLATVDGKQTTFTNSRVSFNVNYHYQVSAVDAAGNESELSRTETGLVQQSSSFKLYASDKTSSRFVQVGYGGYTAKEPNLARKSINNWISRVYVPAYGYIQLFDENDYQGEEYTITNNSPFGRYYNLYDFDDKASSYKTGRTLGAENLKVKEVQEDRVALTWTASKEEIKVKEYHIYRDGKHIGKVDGSETSFIDKEVKAGTSYVYTISGVDAASNPLKDSKNLTVKTKDNQAPTAPKNLRVSSTTGKSVTFSWDASTDNVGVAGYRVYQYYKNIVRVIGTVNGTTFTSAGILTGKDYSYRVVAVDAAGNTSSLSNAIQL